MIGDILSPETFLYLMHGFKVYIHSGGISVIEVHKINK